MYELDRSGDVDIYTITDITVSRYTTRRTDGEWSVTNLRYADGKPVYMNDEDYEIGSLTDAIRQDLVDEDHDEEGMGTCYVEFHGEEVHFDFEWMDGDDEWLDGDSSVQDWNVDCHDPEDVPPYTVLEGQEELDLTPKEPEVVMI